MVRKLTRALLGAIFTLTAVTALYAQPAQTGTVQGEVKDSSGGVLPGVTMTLTSEDRGFTRTAVTDETGKYVFPAVPIGRYTISAGLQGFKTEQATDNLVETDKATIVPFTLSVGALTETVQVTGDIPIVTATNPAANTRVRREEFDKLPIGRNYQSLIAAAPGVVGTGNVNALGALTNSNLFIIDAVDTTDPTTGTFGTNLNFEAIQEVSVYTSGASVEYGRAQGAIVNVVTKAGTNKFEGSAKYIFANDNWDAQNTTKSEVTGASLERVKFDKVNPIYSFTGGGPAIKDHAWFFLTYERQSNTSPQRQTIGPIPEDYQQSTKSNFTNVRGTVQLKEGHTAWVKYFRSPTDGFVIDYWGSRSGEREALTSQNQTADNWAAQWSGVLKNNWSMEAAFASYAAILTVGTFESSGKLNNAPVFNEGDSKYYNGATFDGYTDRPRRQFNLASNWFLTPGGKSHDVKVGLDFQSMESRAEFKYPGAEFYDVLDYVQASGAHVPYELDKFETGPSVSKGKLTAIYARDKMHLTDRFFVEAGLRFERQTGTSDIGAQTVDTTSFAPRVSASYDVAGDGKSLIVGSYGRYYAGILQGFSDAFANVPQQENYDVYLWNGSQYVFDHAVRVGGSDFMPNPDLKPSFMDEGTIGFQRQFGRSMGAGVRFVVRNWADLIDDIYTFRPNGSLDREVINYDAAERKYRGVQFTLERRFSKNWQAQGSYTYSRTEGNHFNDSFTSLGDYLDAQCRTTIDLSVGTNGIIPCSEVNNGANKYGHPGYDRPHNFKLNGAYLRPIGPVNLTIGALTEFVSKARYQRERSVNVLVPGTTINSGRTATYYYEQRGNSPVSGLTNYIDLSTELTWRVAGTNQAGFKAEIFNLTDNQEKTINNNVTWCGTTANASCTTAVNNFGKASARGSFLAPRRYRFSLIYRF